MNTLAELHARLVTAHQRCQAGYTSMEAYGRIEQQIIRELKAAHNRAYGFSMKNGGAS